MGYKITDAEGKVHDLHGLAEPLISFKRAHESNEWSNFVLAIQVEDSVELWSLVDGQDETVHEVLNFLADIDTQVTAWWVLKKSYGSHFNG